MLVGHNGFARLATGDDVAHGHEELQRSRGLLSHIYNVLQ